MSPIILKEFLVSSGTFLIKNYGKVFIEILQDITARDGYLDKLSIYLKSNEVFQEVQNKKEYAKVSWIFWLSCEVNFS